MNYVDLSPEQQFLTQIVAAYCRQNSHIVRVESITWRFNDMVSHDRPASVVIADDGRNIRTYVVEYVVGNYERYFRVKGSHQNDEWRSVLLKDVFSKHEDQ